MSASVVRKGLPLHTPASELAVDLRLAPAELDRKIVALRAQASQTGGLLAALGEDRFRRVVVRRGLRVRRVGAGPGPVVGDVAGGGMSAGRVRVFCGLALSWLAAWVLP